MGQPIDSSTLPMSFRPSQRQFSFYSTDTSLGGSLEYTLTAYLKDFPSNTLIRDTSTATITIDDPCAEAISVSKSASIPDFEYTITEES